MTVIHGKEDKTVFYSDVEAFCVQQQIELIPVEQESMNCMIMMK